jgi:hypothetical protein
MGRERAAAETLTVLVAELDDAALENARLRAWLRELGAWHALDTRCWPAASLAGHGARRTGGLHQEDDMDQFAALLQRIEALEQRGRQEPGGEEFADEMRALRSRLERLERQVEQMGGPLPS